MDFCIRWKIEVFMTLNKVNSSYLISFSQCSDFLCCLKYTFCTLFVEIRIQMKALLKNYFFMLFTCERNKLSWKMFRVSGFIIASLWYHLICSPGPYVSWRSYVRYNEWIRFTFNIFWHGYFTSGAVPGIQFGVVSCLVMLTLINELGDEGLILSL